ncbi:hypothetical protein FB451DRAFT_1391472 [Mycena latifolia]|nr:hypothetical protein FB451DRAFT_1391472 [Mycena latifolia]
MTRVFFALISLACMFQTLAVIFQPPLRRAVTTPECSAANVAASIGIEGARDSLGAINTASELFNARFLLQAQLALLDANNGTTQIADSLLTNAPPAPADANARIMAGLQAAQAALNQTFFFSTDNTTALAVQSAKTSIATALTSAQQALTNNCTTTAE